jgi:hypothetical protein
MTDRTALPRDILRLRDQVWRRRRELRLRSPAAARRFVRRVGFCLFWPTEGVEMPNLLQAIAGNARPLTAGYDDPAIGRSWNWKDDALDKRWWYYGKLLRRRATIVSLDVLPAFYALSENFGDAQDYLIEYREGRLSAEAKAVYEALLEKGPLDAVRLRKNPALGDAGWARLIASWSSWRRLKVLPVGIADAGAACVIYDLADRWFVISDWAKLITTGQAREIVQVSEA